MAREYIDLASGLLVSVPDGVELPASAYRPAGTVASKGDGPSKADLAKQAEALGIKVPSKATKADIAALIDEHAAGAAAASEEAREAVPSGVAPGTETGE